MAWAGETSASSGAGPTWNGSAEPVGERAIGELFLRQPLAEQRQVRRDAKRGGDLAGAQRESSAGAP